MMRLEMIKDLNIKELLFKIQYKLEELFDGKVRDIILYGSYARLENQEDSDIDIIVLVDASDKELKWYENNITDIIVDWSLEYDLVVSIQSQNYDIYERHSNILPYFINIENEGISLYEQ